MSRFVACGCLLASLLAGCGKPPPGSRFPDAESALDRMHASYACSRGVSADAKLDYIGPAGRVRGNVLYLTEVPDRVRLDLSSPFGAMVSTLTSDGRDFALMDLRQKRFLYGPANACNLARFTQISLPPRVLVDLLRGEAPVLVHSPAQASIAWESDRYVLRIAGKHGASQRIELEPVGADFTRPWSEQRVRVLGVEVEQQGVLLYRVGLEEHAPAATAKPRVDPDGLDPPVLPSGPACSAELPRRIRIEVPVEGHDLAIRVNEVAHNPPLLPGVFSQPRPGGVRAEYSACGP